MIQFYELFYFANISTYREIAEKCITPTVHLSSPLLDGKSDLKKSIAAIKTSTIKSSTSASSLQNLRGLGGGLESGLELNADIFAPEALEKPLSVFDWQELSTRDENNNNNDSTTQRSVNMKVS